MNAAAPLYNDGLTLPSNIGELDDSVAEIDLSIHDLRGELSTRTKRVRVLLMCFTFPKEYCPVSLGNLSIWKGLRRIAQYDPRYAQHPH